MLLCTWLPSVEKAAVLGRSRDHAFLSTPTPEDAGPREVDNRSSRHLLWLWQPLSACCLQVEVMMGGISPVSPLASECGSQDWGRRLAGSKQLAVCVFWPTRLCVIKMSCYDDAMHHGLRTGHWFGALRACLHMFACGRLQKC